MSPLLHVINIVTLATWLSAASFGTVGLAVHDAVERPIEKPSDLYDRLETIELSADFLAGDASEEENSEAGDPSEVTEPEMQVEEEEMLPQPPELPELAENEPLPEVPDLPALKPRVAESVAVAPAPPRPTATRKTPTRTQTTATRGSSQGAAGSGGRNSGSGVSDANRLAGGRMTAPRYPSAARAKGQTGTVLVEFIVGENGRVISAHAKRPSPWPLLNESAVAAVLRWKFSPGAVSKFTQPVVFKLN